MFKDVLDLFNSIVLDDGQSQKTTHVVPELGVVLNFVPTDVQLRNLHSCIEHIQVNTLFSKRERDESSALELINKQMLSYWETYLGAFGMVNPGEFELEVDDGIRITARYIRGITKSELGELVRYMLYKNAPVKDATQLKAIIEYYDIDYDLAAVQNNELRIALFDVNNDTFQTGDDAVRWLCYNATGSTMLIKSQEVIAAVGSKPVPHSFFARHATVLANVFNRHKRIILAAKTKDNRAAINHITRLSKKHHVPIRESIEKTFVAKALGSVGFDAAQALKACSLRTIFKILNTLEWKKQQCKNDSFIIRNGKIHNRAGRKVYNLQGIYRVEAVVLAHVAGRLSHLKGESILLDESIDYGLPISHKQTVGKLPFGTTVSMTENISAGIYWKNDWGANDLDLTTVDLQGNRTGWGQYSGYDNANPIAFSGDITWAENGAMEFMTSGKGQQYGLFCNIYSGDVKSSCEVVVGEATDSQWIGEPIIREKTQLMSRGSILGFVNGTKFIVWQGRVSDKNANFGEVNPVIAKATSTQWTLKRLLDACHIPYYVAEDGVDYSLLTDLVDLRYAGFSYDKLEELLLTTKDQ